MTYYIYNIKNYSFIYEMPVTGTSAVTDEVQSNKSGYNDFRNVSMQFHALVLHCLGIFGVFASPANHWGQPGALKGSAPISRLTLWIPVPLKSTFGDKHIAHHWGGCRFLR